LGLIDELVAVTHECDYPREVLSKPRITRSLVDSANQTSAEIDAFVREHLHEHRSIYQLDEEMLEALNPDLILTQELCDVCAVSYEQVQTAVRTLHGDRTILSLEPTDLEAVVATIEAVGRATGRDAAATELSRELRQRIAMLEQNAKAISRPRVACLEWLDPPFSGGHWVPELVQKAGGEDVLGRPGEPSRRLDWQAVLDSKPDVIVLMPCGFDRDRTLVEYHRAALPAGWARLPAVSSGHVYAVNANAYFSRPGPRLVHGIEILSEILQGSAGRPRAGDNWQRVLE
ncbi:MAG: cobalamin-binding protein, partial [Dehalococcoidia bacterium]